MVTCVILSLLKELSMKLRNYLKENNITITAFAIKVGISRKTLHRYLNGENIPMSIQILIQYLTKGEVTADDWTS